MDKIIYVVFRLDEEVSVNNKIVPLPTGNYFIPAFDNYEDALIHSKNGEFEIVEFNIKN